MLLVHPKHRAPFESSALRCYDDVRRLYSKRPVFTEERVVKIQTGTIGQSGAGGIQTFYKEYRFPRPTLRFWIRASKARREFENSLTILHLGVPCAEPVACGELRDGIGRLRSAFIITEAVSGAPPMDQFVPERCGDPHNPAHARLRRAVLEQLADQVALIHRGGFTHNDLHWRNVLVQFTASAQPKLVWIDCPRGRKHVLPQLAGRKMIKDLATLDRDAARYCTRFERLRFAIRYTRSMGNRVPIRTMSAAVERYRLKRWRR